MPLPHCLEHFESGAPDAAPIEGLPPPPKFEPIAAAFMRAADIFAARNGNDRRHQYFDGFAAHGAVHRLGQRLVNLGDHMRENVTRRATVRQRDKTQCLGTLVCVI